MKRSEIAFDIVTAQPRAWSILSRSFLAGRVASCYLFTGPYGSGHWALASAFASLLNCRQRVDGGDPDGNRTVRPCGQCPPCRTIAAINFEGLYPVVPIQTYKNDIEKFEFLNACLDRLREEPLAMIEEEKAATIRIEQSRDVKLTLSRRGSEEIVRVAIFDRAQKMRDDSADSLLKLIEEPPPRTVIILTAERAESLLPTIQSRAQEVRLARSPEAMIAQYLETAYGAPSKQAVLLARLAEGLPGRAIRLMGPEDEEEAPIRSVAWLVFKLLFQRPSGEAMQVAMEQLASRGRSDIEQSLLLWQSLIRDCADFAIRSQPDQLTNVDFADELMKLSRPFEASGLAESLLIAIKNTLADLYLNVHIHTALAALVLKMRAAIRQAESTAVVS
ncbi:MAG: hypothetical protein RBT76_00315 [candidate division Zixibacteria bacterium]|nr:hypothetical protein [candidate division Zixibacteria bacterium]